MSALHGVLSSIILYNSGPYVPSPITIYITQTQKQPFPQPYRSNINMKKHFKSPRPQLQPQHQRKPPPKHKESDQSLLVFYGVYIKSNREPTKQQSREVHLSSPIINTLPFSTGRIPHLSSAQYHTQHQTPKSRERTRQHQHP